MTISHATGMLGLMKKLSRRSVIAAAAIAAYLSSVVLANWLTTRYGFVPVGFSRTATAGTFAAGGALVVRDVVQDAVGRIGVLVLIGITGLVSYLVADPSIATASMVAFLASEILDMTAYTPLRVRAKFGDWRWRAAVAVGGMVGAITDTLIFLTIAFGWAAVSSALPGQLIGKGEVIAGFLIVGTAVRTYLRPPLDATYA